MTISNWISVASIIVSLGIASWSAYQTKVAAQLASRPYISIYLEAIDTVYFSKYLVIKNFGNSSAIIKTIDFIKLDESNKYSQDIQVGLNGLINGSIGPKQKLTMSLKDNYKAPISLKVTYTDSNGKEYKDIFHIKTDMMSKMLWSSVTTTSDTQEASAIKNAAAGIIKTIK
ncbi:hypothetical protein [Limosilactobacillus fastidiosus]|uniref:DUF5067 domain-containing protein n=1 Tax=Limosilactobacillus fastidiosus TaxID=2759855 RepID=A0ABR6E8S9_9LACO|nr:hypothetical protein [Limosilactobacillus fastidiosus]MBB1063601.1 hypothetical protein [Limosilactobacillus fastidiosus]MCD7084177.1 hypothetical protein [Limosilactobacillus fastidiosus]